MAKRTKNSAPPFTEAQARTWLSWLARGMQTHGQTVFTIEQLQPSWLSTRGQRWAYLVISRLFAWLIPAVVLGLGVGLTVGIYGQPQFASRFSAGVIAGLSISAAMLTIGLSIVFIDGFRAEFAAKVPPPQNLKDSSLSFETRRVMSVRQRTPLTSITTSVFTVGAAAIVILLLALFLPLRNEASQLLDLGDLLLLVVIFAVGSCVGVFWGIRGANRDWKRDIRTVETLSWSWRTVKGYLPHLVALAVIGCCCGPFLGLSLALFFFAGIQPGIIELKSRANEGMTLSMRSAALTALAGLVVGLAVAYTLSIFLLLPIVVMVPRVCFDPSLPYENVVLAMIYIAPYTVPVGIVTGLVAGAWYGGLDVIQHYVLRLILWNRVHVPLRFSRFLDYAADELNFLQKVGGGYIFMHRILLEHFADMKDDVKSNAQDSPPLAVASLFESQADGVGASSN